uniref:Uncharacterized protein n=1 Tax=Timema cristinae TaxID=61476 RepID=A0A7R9H120_TIMCR|nr:unnamed protein product [Timema cristinae]
MFGICKSTLFSSLFPHTQSIPSNQSCLPQTKCDHVDRKKKNQRTTRLLTLCKIFRRHGSIRRHNLPLRGQGHRLVTVLAKNLVYCKLGTTGRVTTYVDTENDAEASISPRSYVGFGPTEKVCRNAPHRYCELTTYAYRGRREGGSGRRDQAFRGGSERESDNA